MKRTLVPFHSASTRSGKAMMDFFRTVTLAWDILVVGSLNFVWERKLINTKATLKVWVKLTQKNPFSERKEALQKLLLLYLKKSKKLNSILSKLSDEKKNTGD